MAIDRLIIYEADPHTRLIGASDRPYGVREFIHPEAGFGYIALLQGESQIQVGFYDLEGATTEEPVVVVPEDAGYATYWGTGQSIHHDSVARVIIDSAYEEASTVNS